MSKKNSPISKEIVEALLEVTAEKIAVTKNDVRVVVSGKELGYNDGQYYEMTWTISDKEVQSDAYADCRLRDFITTNVYTGEVTSLEAFAKVVNGKAEDGGRFE